MAWLERAPLALLAVAMSGCIWITAQDVQDKEACLDKDGDLYVADAACPELPAGMVGVDCDDRRDYRNPGIDEEGNPDLWYDGIDQDCDRADVIDQDGDLYAPITQEAWEALVEADGNQIQAWPAQIETEPPDGFDSALDCNDLNNTIFPDSPAEEPYDAIDSDCGGDDDYDFDGDGFAIIDDCLPEDAPAYTGSLTQSDCDDTDATVNTDEESDTWYDGIDQDCDFANDFDQDGDGYIQDIHISAYNAFVATCGQSDTRTVGDDCNDTPAGEGGVPGVDINPGETETWYDNVDQDCAGDSDFDQDHDNFECDGSVIAACSGHSGTDCVDTNENINASALELVGDEVDQDCDTEDDGAPFAFHDYVWTLPNAPIAGATATDYILAATADAFTFPGAAFPNEEAGVVAVWTPAATLPPVIPSLKVDFEGPFNTWPLYEGVALAQHTDGWLVATSHERGGKTFLRAKPFVGSDGAYDQPTNDLAFHSDFSTDTQYDYAAWEDDTNNLQWVAACGDNNVQFMVTSVDNDGVTLVDGALEAVTGGRACIIEPVDADTVDLHVYTGGGDAGHLIYTLDLETSAIDDASITLSCQSGGEAPCDATDAFGLVDVNQRGTLTVFAGGDDSTTVPKGVTIYDDGTLVDEFLTAYTVLSADAWMHNDVLYIVAVKDNGDSTSDVVFAYGNPEATLAEVTLDFTHPTLTVEPQGASIFVDDDRIFIGVSALGDTGDEGDAIGWVFMGHAP